MPSTIENKIELIEKNLQMIKTFGAFGEVNSVKAILTIVHSLEEIKDDIDAINKTIEVNGFFSINSKVEDD